MKQVPIAENPTPTRRSLPQSSPRSILLTSYPEIFYHSPWSYLAFPRSAYFYPPLSYPEDFPPEPEDKKKDTPQDSPDIRPDTHPDTQSDDTHPEIESDVDPDATHSEETPEPPVKTFCSQGCTSHFAGPRQLEHIRQLFDEITAQEQEITPELMRLYLKRSHIYISDHDLGQLIELYDSNKSGGLYFEEFLQFMIEQEEHIHRIFHEADANNTGVLEPGEVREVFETLGLSITDDELVRLMAHVDESKTNYITFPEFYRYLYRHQFVPSRMTLDGIFHFWNDHVSSIVVDVDGFLPVEVEERGVDEPGSSTLWKYFVGGGLAGSLSRTVTAPLDRISVLLQVQNEIKPTSKLRFHNIRTGFRTLIRETGWRSLWRGNGVNVLKSFPELSLRACLYEFFKRFITNHNDLIPYPAELGLTERFVASISAAVVAQAVVYPLEYVKTRIVTSSEKLSVWRVLKETVREKGVRILYSGLCPSLLRVSVDLAIFEYLKKVHYHYHVRFDPKHRLPSISALLGIGTCVAVTTQMATFPLFLVRSRLQIQGGGVRSDTHYLSMRDAFSKIYRAEGIRGFYHGALANGIRTVPNVVMTFFSFEIIKRMFGVASYA